MTSLRQPGVPCRWPGLFYYIKPRVEDCRKKARRRFVYFFFFFFRKKEDHTSGQTLMKGGHAPSPASESEMKKLPEKPGDGGMRGRSQ